MKPLMPSHREKKRYLLVKGRNLKKNIEKAIFEFSGELGMAKAGLKFIESGKDYVIICINRNSLNLVRASLSIYHEKITVDNVSGTLNKLRSQNEK